MPSRLAGFFKKGIDLLISMFIDTAEAARRPAGTKARAAARSSARQRNLTDIFLLFEWETGLEMGECSWVPLLQDLHLPVGVEGRAI